MHSLPFFFTKIIKWMEWELEAHAPDFTLQERAEAGIFFFLDGPPGSRK